MAFECNLRKYGKAPFAVAVIHGGPGAPGIMAPVARELSSDWGILEPLQTSASLDGQVQELKDELESVAEFPVILIGASWGAWLSYIIAARYPALVRKIILVGSGGFEAKYAEGMHDTRLSRLSKAEQEEVTALLKDLYDPSDESRNSQLARMGELFAKTDNYDILAHDDELIEFQADVHANVWREAAELRKSGELLSIGAQIKCPVVAIHGDYDPHPAEGVIKPLSGILSDFKYFVLPNCGHEPWIEKQARHRFFEIVRQELQAK